MAAENFKVKKGLEVGTGITANSDGINVTGIITATQYRGDGSGLTGVVASGTGVIVKDEGSAVGTAGTFNFVGSGVAATLSAGTATVTIDSGGLTDIVDDTTPQLGGNLDLNSKFITGSGNIDITGSLDVSGISTTGFVEVGNLTNGRVPYAGSASGRLVDSANLTFDGTNLFVSGINVTSAGTTSTFGADISTRNLSVSGISTFNSIVNIMSGLDLQTNGTLDIIGSVSSSGLDIQSSSSVQIGQNGFPNHDYAIFANSGVTLKHNNQTKLTTTSSGITVPDLEATGTGTFGQVDTMGVTLGTNNNTFAAKFIDNAVANFGTDNDLKISHDNTHARITNSTGSIVVVGIISATNGVKGALTGNADTATTATNVSVSANNTLAATVYPLFAGNGATATGDLATSTDTGLNYNPSTGRLTAASYAGDGSALTGVVASGTGIIVRHDGNVVGTAASINFSTNLDVSPISAGIVTVTASGGSSATDSISEGNSSAEVIGSGTDDGEFKVVLQDSTSSGAGHTTFRLYQSATDTNKLDLFSENFSNKAVIEIKSMYSGYARHQIKFATNNASYGGELDFLGSLGQWNFYSRYQNNNKNIISFNHNNIGVGDDIYPTTNNAFDLGYSSYKFRNFHVINVQAGIVTATTFSGSGASLTTLNASELDSGTIPNGRFPTTLPATSGANLTNLPVPTQITVADESSDQTCNILFTTAATGDLAPKSSSTLTYDSNGEVLSATLFSGSGASLTNLNASNIGSGTMSASRLTGALPAISGASLTNLPAPTPATSDIQVVYEITNQSSFSYFRFAGNGVDSSANNPDIYLTRGQKYRFINNSGGSHPFQIQTTGGSAYTTGVTYTPEHSSGSNSASSGNIDFAIRWDAPSQLKYVCTSHGSMVGNIYIDGGDAERRTTANAATGSIANAAAANISITAAKTYSLLKIQTSAAAWVTLYTDSTSRSNDSSRSETTDPTPGSGVIAEVITTGAATQIMTPGIIGWNNDGTPASTVYAKVVNKSGSTQAITVTLHYLALEI